MEQNLMEIILLLCTSSLMAKVNYGGVFHQLKQQRDTVTAALKQDEGSDSEKGTGRFRQMTVEVTRDPSVLICVSPKVFQNVK